MDEGRKDIVKYDIIPEDIKSAMVWKTDFNHLKLGIQHHFRGTTIHYLICGCLLTEAHSKKIWDKDGSMARNFGEWCEREMFLRRSQVQRMIQIWSSLKPIIEKQLDLILQIDYSKLALIAPYIMKLDEEKQIELLHEGQHLSVKDLESNLKERAGGVVPDMCPHLEELMEEWLRCKKCGKFFKKEAK